MMTANQERINRGEAMAFSYDEMMGIIDKYHIHHNAVITNLHQWGNKVE